MDNPHQTRLLFFAPRFHSNQIDMVRCLGEGGYQVTIATYYSSKSEDHSFGKVIPIAPCRLSLFFTERLRGISEQSRLAQIVWPNLLSLATLFKNERPQAIVLRGLSSRYILCALPFAFAYNSRIIVYTQGPKWRSKDTILASLAREFAFRILRAKWYTPVERRMNDTGPLKTDSRVNFIPFFKYCNDRRDDSDYDRLRFIAIGKFEPRKNHLLAVRAFAAAAPPPSTLTLIGEVTSDQHKDSLKEVEREIDRLSIEGRTSIYTNLTPSEVKSHLAKHNVCLMVSRNELASISQIEAMASGLAVICTTDNGTAHYIDDTCGLHCEPNISSIADAIAKYANSKDLAKIHGRNAQERLKTDFSIDSAFHSFSKLVNP